MNATNYHHDVDFGLQLFFPVAPWVATCASLTSKADVYLFVKDNSLEPYVTKSVLLLYSPFFFFPPMGMLMLLHPDHQRAITRIRKGRNS